MDVGWGDRWLGVGQIQYIDKITLRKICANVKNYMSKYKCKPVFSYSQHWPEEGTLEVSKVQNKFSKCDFHEKRVQIKYEFGSSLRAAVKEGKKKRGEIKASIDTHIKTLIPPPSPFHHHPFQTMHSQVDMTQVLEKCHSSQKIKE